MIGPMSLVDPSPIDPSMVQPFEPETDRARGGDTIPLGPPRKPRFRKITPDERKAFTKELQDQEILPAAVKLAGSISKVAQDIGYVPSTGFVSSVVEGALQSAPHFLGGVALTAAGGTVAGPVGAFAASAGYFGATEGASHTADTYRKLIDSGVDQMTALDTASAEGALYGAASGLLEFAGVETVLQSKRFAKSLEKVVGSSKWQQAGASVLLAGSGEGTTEVLQGVVGESLQAYATDNWDDFKTKYSNSTEPAQEFLSAFLLGGTVRGGIEVLDPTNYDSLFEYREASGADAGDIPADRAMIGADGKVTFISDAQRAEMGPSPTPKSDAAQRVADAIGAGETPSPEDLRLAADSVPAGGSGRGNGAVGRIVNGAADDTLDPVEVIPAAEAIISEDGTVSQSDLVPPKSDEEVAQQVGQFFSANKTTGKIVDPETDQQSRIQTEAAGRGVQVLFVRGDGELGRPAASPSQGLILIDADLPPGRQTDAVAWHEMVHEVEHRDSTAWATLHNDLSDLSPELMAEARRRYQAGWKAQTGEDISGEILGREGPSVAAELVIDFIMAEGQSPGTLGRMLAEKPGLKERIIDIFQAMLRRVGLNVGVEKLERARQTREGVAAALLIRDAVGMLKGYSPGTASAAGSATPVIAPSLTAQAEKPVEKQPPEPTIADSSPVIVPVTDGNPAPSPIFPRNKKGGEFSNRDIRRRVRQHAVDLGFEETNGIGALDLTDDELAAIGSDSISFSFSGPLPAEINRALSGQNRGVRNLFKANVPRAEGADSMAVLGADRMVDIAKRFAERGDVGVDRFLGDRGRVDTGPGDLPMLRVVERLRGGQPAKDNAPIEVIDEPGGLPDGATFEIEGDEFVVYTAENSDRRASDGDLDFSINIESMPITKGSLRKDAGAEVAEAALDIPFAVRNQPGGDQGVFGQRMFRSQTGKQNPLFESQEQSETPLERELREKVDAKDKEIGSDADQKTLFAVKDFSKTHNMGELVDDLGITLEEVQKFGNMKTMGGFKRKLARLHRQSIADKKSGNTLTNPELRDKQYRSERNREKLRAQIVDEVLTLPVAKDETDIRLGKHGAIPEGGVSYGRMATIVIGPPGAGKSTIIDPLVEQTQSAFLSADIVKRKNPEFGGATELIHEESAQVLEGRIFPIAAELGMNVVLEKVGKSKGSIETARKLLRERGYRVNLTIVNLPFEVALKRALLRATATDRYVSADYMIEQVGDRPMEVYDELVKEGLFDETRAYSNDVPAGSPPVEITGQRNQRSGSQANAGSVRDGQGTRDHSIRSGETGSRRGSADLQQRGTRPLRDRGLGSVDTDTNQSRFAVRDDGQQDLPNARAAESFIEQGRPDLANPGNTEPNRRLVNTVDELRNAAGQPVRKDDEVVERRADEMMAIGKGIETKLRDKVDRGEVLDDVETVVAQRLVNQRAAEAIRKGDKAAYREALITIDAYRRSGTIAARAFRQRRDKQKGPKERYREALMGAFLEPDSGVREKLHDIREKLMDPNLSERNRKKAKKQQELLFDREADRITKIKKDLGKAGIDVRLINEESMLDPVLASKVVDTAQRTRGSKVDALYWVWMNSILSGPLTHAANILGNAANLAFRFSALKGIEAVQGSVAKRAGGDPDFTIGDWMHMWKSLGPAVSSGFTNMARSYATNRQVFDEQITGEPLPLNVIKGEKVQLPTSGPRSKVLRVAGLGGLPLKLLMAEDQLFKTTAGVMEAHALAHRQAVREGLTGEARNERITELLAPKPELYGESLDSDIWRQSLEEARVAVFQDEPSVIGKTALDLRQGALGPILKWIVPFVRTPDRLFVRGIEVSPLGLLPAVGQAVKSVPVIGSAVPSSIAQEGAVAKDIARAVVVLGLLAAVYAWKDDEDGFPRITGSRSQVWRDLPEQYRTAPPLSIRFGDKWYSYARIEPLSTGLALTVDLFDRNEQGKDMGELVTGSGETLIALTQDKTFVRSIGQIMEAFSNPDRSSEILTNQARRTFVTAWVPNLFKQATRAFNPEIVDNRAASDSGFWTKQATKIPYEALPSRRLAPVPRFDIWGRPLVRSDPFDGGAAGIMWRLGVPINVSEANLHPMDLLIWNYNEKVARGEIDRALDVDGADKSGEIHPKPPARYFTRNGQRINMTAEEYQELVRSVGVAASKRLLGIGLNVDDPGPGDVRRIVSVFKREYTRGRNRIYRERRSADE